MSFCYISNIAACSEGCSGEVTQAGRLWLCDVKRYVVVSQVARKLAMVEADLERAEERAETGES